MPAIDDHSEELTAIRRLAVVALIAELSDTDMSTSGAALGALRDVAIDIVQGFGEQAAMSAVRYLELDRFDAGATSLPEAVPSDLPGADQVDGTLTWALEPLDQDDLGAARKRLFGSTQRLVLQPARETVWDNTQRAKTTFARVPKPGACDWCLMLGSRGAVYDESTVLTITGRSSRTSGRPAGLRYHDNCKCESREIRSDDEIPDVNRRLEQLWQDHAGSDFNKWTAYLAENPFEFEPETT